MADNHGGDAKAILAYPSELARHENGDLSSHPFIRLTTVLIDPRGFFLNSSFWVDSFSGPSGK
jgi:hypothetical protein